MATLEVLACPLFKRRRRCAWDWKLDRASLLRFRSNLAPVRAGEVDDQRLRDCVLNVIAGATAGAPAAAQRAAGQLRCRGFSASVLWRKMEPLYTASVAKCPYPRALNFAKAVPGAKRR